MLKISEKDIALIAKRIKIPFVRLLAGEGRVCFAGNADVRPEFLESFNEGHVLNYISGCLETKSDKSAIIKIPFPKTADCFWKAVRAGEKESLPNPEEFDIEVIFYES
jgi:hypothetical protein